MWCLVAFFLCFLLKQRALEHHCQQYRLLFHLAEKCIYDHEVYDTALPPWSTQGRTEKDLGLEIGTERIAGQWRGGGIAGGSGRTARSHRRRGTPPAWEVLFFFDKLDYIPKCILYSPGAFPS